MYLFRFFRHAKPNGAATQAGRKGMLMNVAGAVEVFIESLAAGNSESVNTQAANPPKNLSAVNFKVFWVSNFICQNSRIKLYLPYI